MMISPRPRPPLPLHLAVEPARLGPQVEHAQVRRVVDPQRRLLELVADLDHLRPVVADLALAQLVAGDPRPLGDQALGELGVGHLEREEGDRSLELDRDVLGDVGDEAGLAHPRASGEDDQVAGLEAPGDLVEVVESRRGAAELGAAAGELLEPVDLPGNDLGDLVEVLGLLLVGDLKQHPLRVLGQLHRLVLAVVDGRLDPLRGLQQAAQERVLLDDARVVAGVAGDRDGRGEVRDDFAAADLLELALLCEELGNGERVDRLAALVEPFDRVEDLPVALAVEVLLGQPDVEDHRVHRDLGDHQGAEHRLLCLEVLGRYVGGGGFHRSVGLEGGADANPPRGRPVGPANHSAEGTAPGVPAKSALW